MGNKDFYFPDSINSTSMAKLCNSFTSKHACRIFPFSFKWKNSCSVWETSGKIFQTQPTRNFTPILKFRCSYFRNFESGQTDAVVRNFERFTAYIKAIIIIQICFPICVFFCLLPSLFLCLVSCVVCLLSYSVFLLSSLFGLIFVL